MVFDRPEPKSTFTAASDGVIWIGWVDLTAIPRLVPVLVSNILIVEVAPVSVVFNGFLLSELASYTVHVLQIRVSVDVFLCLIEGKLNTAVWVSALLLSDVGIMLTSIAFDI